MKEYGQYLDKLKNNPPPLAINVVGPPNGGKGTQCAILSRILGVPTISVGDLIRQEQLSGSQLGEEFKYYTENRLVAPASMTLQLLSKRLCRSDCEKGYILEGYPRTMDNAEAIKGYINFDMVIELRVPERVLFERMALRGRHDDRPEKQRVGMDIYNNESLLVAKTLVDASRYYVVKEVDANFDLVRESGLDNFNCGEFASLEHCSGNFDERKTIQKEAIYKNEFNMTKFDCFGVEVAEALGIDLDSELDSSTIIKFINAKHTNFEMLRAVESYKVDKLLEDAPWNFEEVRARLSNLEKDIFKGENLSESHTK